MTKTTIDTQENTVTVEEDGEALIHPLASAEGFEAVANAYLRAGWDNKYVYSFTWLGRPIIQLPDDILRAQELIFSVKPDILIEIGVAHGGSLILYSSIMEAIGTGRVIGVDINIRPHNRHEIENHRMAKRISLIEGDSIAQDTVQQVSAQIKSSDSVMIFLDGKHTYDHVTRELELYAPLITPDSYIVAMDGIQQSLVGAPRSQADWDWNNSAKAAIDFVAANEGFTISEPGPLFNEGNVTKFVTYWPSAYIKRL